MPEAELARSVAACRNDPLAFVERVFPWGQGPLATESGPDRWQRDLLAAFTRG
jgi:hypothetical protein